MPSKMKVILFNLLVLSMYYCRLTSCATVHSFKVKEIHSNKIRHLNTSQTVSLHNCARSCANHPGNAVSELERCYAISYDPDTKDCSLKNFILFELPSGVMEAVHYGSNLLRELRR